MTVIIVGKTVNPCNLRRFAPLSSDSLNSAQVWSSDGLYELYDSQTCSHSDGSDTNCHSTNVVKGCTTSNPFGKHRSYRVASVYTEVTDVVKGCTSSNPFGKHRSHRVALAYTEVIFFGKVMNF